MEASLLVQIYAPIGFLLAAYLVLLFTLWYGWSLNGGDISYGNYYQLR